MKIFSGKRFFVYGAGVSGRAAFRAIKRRGGKVRIYGDVAGRFTRPQDADYSGAIISPGVPFDHEVYAYCEKEGIPAMGEAELGFRLATAPIVGVTGTNGKTTVTRLIADMLGGTACGNIGYPLTAAIDKSKNAPLVCELSSFQLRGAHGIAPKVAVITNIAADHLDRHGTLEDYQKSKCNIASEVTGDVVLGDATVGALGYLKTKARLVYCSTERPVDGAYIENGYFCFFGRRVCHVDYFRLRGRHNLINALCAIAAAKCMGAENTAILSALSTAQAAPHRLEDIGYACGKRWIDDSKGTNIAATMAALDATDGDMCLILGGRDKALDWSGLFERIKTEPREIYAVAMGESALDIREAAASVGIKITVTDGLSDAVRAAAASPAPTVLLSPGCTSFDEFGSYTERGERFALEVKRLDGKK